MQDVGKNTNHLVSELGQSCHYHSQCTATFSECLDGICHCKSGFWPSSGKCSSKGKSMPIIIILSKAQLFAEYSCPTGEPVLNDGLVIECKLVQTSKATLPSSNIQSNQIQNPNIDRFIFDPNFFVPSDGVSTDVSDTCGDGQFCMVTSGSSRVVGATGHCCLKSKSKCPIGSPHRNASCSEIPGNGPMCPTDTHFCTATASVYGNKQEQLCCPKACPGNQVAVDGKCYPMVQYNDPCQVDEQCRMHNGVCREGMT